MREKSTLCNNFIQKRGVGIFLRVGLFLGDYGTLLTLLNLPEEVVEESWWAAFFLAAAVLV